MRKIKPNDYPKYVQPGVSYKVVTDGSIIVYLPVFPNEGYKLWLDGQRIYIGCGGTLHLSVSRKQVILMTNTSGTYIRTEFHQRRKAIWEMKKQVDAIDRGRVRAVISCLDQDGPDEELLAIMFDRFEVLSVISVANDVIGSTGAKPATINAINEYIEKRSIKNEKTN